MTLNHDLKLEENCQKALEDFIRETEVKKITQTYNQSENLFECILFFFIFLWNVFGSNLRIVSQRLFCLNFPIALLIGFVY